MFVQNMASLAVAMVVAMKKNIEKKIKKLKFYEMSKYHVFRKQNFLYFPVPLNVKSDFFRKVLK